MDYFNQGQAAQAMIQTPPQDAPLFQRLVSGAEALAERLHAAENRLGGVLVRAVGPKPASAESNSAQPAPQGHIGALDLRLTSSLRCLERIEELLAQLERII